MKELKKVVTDTMVNIINNGSLELMISEQVEETVKSCVKDVMKPYSGFGIAIKEKIKTSLNASLDNISIPEYNKFIQSVVADQYGKIVNENAVDHLQKLIGDLIEPVAKEDRFSTIIDRVTEIWTNDAREHHKDRIVIETSCNDKDTAIYVTFKHPEYDFYDVKATFYRFGKKKTWHIGYINEGDSVVTKRPTNMAKPTHSVTDMLFSYYAMGTEFKDDCEFEDIELNEY